MLLSHDCKITVLVQTLQPFHIPALLNTLTPVLVLTLELI